MTRFTFRRSFPAQFAALLLSIVAAISPTIATSAAAETTGLETAATVIVPVIDFPGFENAGYDNGTFEHFGQPSSRVSSESVVMFEDTCSWGTHDSCPLPSLAAERIANHHHVSSPATSASAFATAVLGTVGIRVQQIIEPFAMIQPQVDQEAAAGQIARVDRFLSWWESNLAPRVQATPLVDQLVASIEDRLQQIASQEPLDVIGYGPSVVETAVMPIAKFDRVEAQQPQVAEPGIVITKLDPLVGSAPVIATISVPEIATTSVPVIAMIGDAYLPYDLSDRDRKMWSYFASSRRPFTNRQARLFDDRLTDSMAQYIAWTGKEVLDDAIEKQVAMMDSVDDPFAFEDTDAKDANDEQVAATVKTISDWASRFGSALDLGNVGSVIADVIGRGQDVISEAAVSVAGALPEAKEQEIATAGDKLLARAGAVEAAEVAAEPAAEVASLPTSNDVR